MHKNLLHTVTLGALLTLSAAPYAGAADHSKMDHAAMGHGAAAAEKPAPASTEIRKAVVKGYTLTYTLIDMKKMMAASSTPMAHDMTKMKSHHLMVNPVAADGKAVATGKAGFQVVQPDKTKVQAMAMLMEGGFGADLDFVAKGDYAMTTKITFGETTLIDDFVYSVK